jgi:hypothetical protein
VSTLGPRGIALLSVAGIAGVVLALHGWSQRGTGLVAGQPASPPPSAAPSAPGPAGAAAGLAVKAIQDGQAMTSASSRTRKGRSCHER